jgi:hypothetical protein
VGILPLKWIGKIVPTHLSKLSWIGKISPTLLSKLSWIGKISPTHLSKLSWIGKISPTLLSKLSWIGKISPTHLSNFNWGTKFRRHFCPGKISRENAGEIRAPFLPGSLNCAAQCCGLVRGGGICGRCVVAAVK